MAIPASGAISSSMLAAEFSSSQAPNGPNISLGGLGTKLSTSITFGNQVLMAASFYGQSAFSGTAFSYNSAPEDNPTEACSLEEMENTAYHNGSGTYPATGDNVYSDSAGTTPLENGSTYKYNNGGDNGGFLNIGASGVVSSLGNCRG